MANYHCLLLDGDGTLLNFAAAEHEAISETLRHYDTSASEENIALYSKINDDLWKEHEQGKVTQEQLAVLRFEKLCTALGIVADAKEMSGYYRSALANNAQVLPGAREVLEELSEVATLVLVSNGIEEIQMSRMEKSGLLPYFDGVFISSRVGAAKPNRKVFDVALEEMGVNHREKVLMIGDSLTADIRGGNNAGIATCWCNFNDEENITDIQPTYTVHSFEELYPIVMEQEELNHVGDAQKRHTI